MYKFVFIKIMAAIISAIACTTYNSWTIYTPVSDRLTHTYYYSFMGIFAINFVPSFFIFMILGVILSPIVDSVIYRRFSVKGIKGILTIILAYLMLGMVGGMFVSLFFFKINFISYFIYVSMISAMVFLCVQSILQFCLYKRGVLHKKIMD